jgi:hypothetical protein
MDQTGHWLTPRLRNNLDSFMNSLNSSRLEMLALTENTRLVPASLARLIDSLSTPHLNELHLSICNIGPDLAEPIIRYLISGRSRNLELLGLNGNNMGHKAVQDIVDAVEGGNFTIRNLGLYANRLLRATAPTDEGEMPFTATPPTDTEQRESTQLSYETERIPPLLERNRDLTTRVQLAAVRCLPRARILLNATRLSAVETARSAMESVSLNTHTPYFRLLDLPPEVLYLIVRHTSGDASALSDAQFTRIRKDAEGGEGLRRAVRMSKNKTRGWDSDADTRKELNAELKNDWLKSGRWNKWESDVRVLETSFRKDRQDD